MHFISILIATAYYSVFYERKIILLGYMGSGKSTIGQLLAHALDLPFEDLDSFIERKEGKKISEIFALKGEIYFRKQEQPTSLSCWTALPYGHRLGRRYPCYGKAMELIRAASPYSFYLQLPTSELMARLLPEKAKRPLIAHLSFEDIEEFLNKHLFERFPFYTQAHFILPVMALAPPRL
ncbi:Shikimate kinase [Capnocytophaga granulosa]|uniref:shikimate kinase n=1 Tax=Capnocytophaga granulosa TaxID=45242 RepID=UPI000E125AD5|nr:shikimate kinase [Capnocytophaga granulosa]SUX93643.1 Shikimate kinase [Capnocytophaga granulosa]